MTVKKYREPEVDVALGMVDADGKIVKFEGDEPVEKQGPLRVMGTKGEILEVTVISEDVVRVTHVPTAAGNAPVSRTWVVSNGEKMNDLEGWARSDMGRFGSLGKAKVVEEKSTGKQRFTVSTGKVSMRLGGSLDSKVSHNPFRIEWFVDGGETSFACDSILSAYAYEDGGMATHRMERRPKEEFYYGLGEVSGELNRAGRRFRLECRDAMGYDAQVSDPLYKHCPFYITYNAKYNIAYGIVYDQLCSGTIDLGMEISAFRGSFRTYQADSGFVDYFLVLGPTIPQVVEKVGRLIGRPAVPPGWALGYVASTMTYSDASDAQNRLESFPRLCAKHNMHCDGFYLSSGYTMDNEGNRNVFTWNLDRIPEPERVLSTFHEHKMGVIANVKPWLLKAHPRYAEMTTLRGFFRRDSQEEEDVVGWFWKGGPGTFAAGSYLDFTNPITFSWWKTQLKNNVLQQGVDAVWNDNNEFEIEDSSALCYFKDQPIGLLGRTLQTFLMAKSSYEALLEARPEKRPLVVSRSGCLGVSRYAAQTWSGDNTTSFHTMKWNIPMSLGLGLCGWVGNGADIGGFAGDAVTPELFVRWIQLGVYMPRFSIHSSSWKPSVKKGADSDGAALNSTDGYNLDCTNEPWMFPEYEDTVRELLGLRFRLRPLLLSLHLESFLNSFPVMRPLVFHFADDLNPRSRVESFEFTLGESLLVASVLEEGATSVDVYFPGNNGVSVQHWCDLESGEWYEGGQTIQVPAALQGRSYGSPIFLRNGSGLVLYGETPQEREITLATSPENPCSVNLTWFEDPSPEQSGRVEGPEDMVAVDLDAEVDPDTGVIRIVQFEIVNRNHIIPFTTLKLRLPPNDPRSIVIGESVKHRDMLAIV